MGSQGDKDRALGRLLSMELLDGFAFHQVMKMILDLQIPDIIAQGGGQLSVAEIVARLPTQTANVEFLARTMTFAAVCDIFTVDMTDRDGGIVENGEKLFGLTEVSKLLVKTEKEDDQPSVVHWTQCLISQQISEPFQHLAGAVLSGQSPFHIAYGKGFWEAQEADPAWNTLFQKAMMANAAHVTMSLLRSYKGFEGVKRLVDVGGGSGASLTAIVGAHPDIHGVNFDLPHVVSVAPHISGVEHQGGSFFSSVPEGDAIFMKYVLHNWTDQQCVCILTRCHDSLPQTGKVIIVEHVLPDPKEARPTQYTWDMVMLTTAAGRERTAPEWLRVLKGANFQRVEFIPIPAIELYVIEGYKA